MNIPFLSKRPKIGLALGSGGPKGLAHLGVIETLVKHHIPIDFIAGSSAGAIAGSFYAATQDVEAIRRFFMDQRTRQVVGLFTDPSLHGGLFQGKRIRTLLAEFLKDITFDRLKIPFRAVAADLATGQSVVLEKGKVLDAVMASSSIPMVFKPTEIDGALLVDGAVTSPVPVEAVRAMGADIVIAVNLHGSILRAQVSSSMNIFDVGMTTFSHMSNNLAREEEKQADIVVWPEVASMGWKQLGDEEHKNVTIGAGVAAMEEQMLKLRALIQKQKTGPALRHFAERIRRFISGS